MDRFRKSAATHGPERALNLSSRAFQSDVEKHHCGRFYRVTIGREHSLAGCTKLFALQSRNPLSSYDGPLGVTQMSNRIAATRIKLKRAYERPARGDGRRILIDRLWPRGVKKANAAIDEWIKDLAPSTALRKWFGHDPARWKKFRSRYAAEVQMHPEQLRRLR